MPQITIREVDKTQAGSVAAQDNVVYIPGYATMGPINTPTLCTTLDEFYDTFGRVPYEFRTNQNYFKAEEGKIGFSNNSIPSSYSVFAKAGSEEQSFIYAQDVLASGLPVLFERVMSADNINLYTARAELTLYNAEGTSLPGKLLISSKDAGKEAAGIKVEINFKQINGNNLPEYELKINDKETHTISFDIAASSFYKNIESDTITLDLLNSKGELPDGTIPGFVVPEGSAAAGTTDVAVMPDLAQINLIVPVVDGEGITYTPITTVLTIKDENLTKDEFTVQDFYKTLNSVIEDTFGETTTFFSRLEDKGEYQIKFITTGAYPNFEIGSIANNMLAAAATRGDCTALIDHTNNTERELVGTGSVFEAIQTIGDAGTRKHGAMFTPWAYYTSKVNGNVYTFPGSYGYLISLGASLRTNAAWYAVAGTTRGLLSGFKRPCQIITGAIGERFQQETGVSINPILNIKPYGYCIWGNRTLHLNDGLVASSFLNIRMLTNDIKKVVYQTAKRLTFELNDNILWLNFRAAIEPTLDKMVSGNGLSDYKIIKKASKKKATIEAVIRLYAIEAVESWDITIELSDSYVSAE